MSHKKVLIVSAVPYSKTTSGRSLNTYFKNWEHDNVAQVFSVNKTPVKGHCGKMYQITDEMLLKRRLKKNTVVGKEYLRDNLKDDVVANNVTNNTSGKLVSKMYKSGRRKTSLKLLLRKNIWKKKYWNTPRFNEWLDDFKPEVVFVCLSNAFYVQEIALYVAEKYNIPIITIIYDDYYFDNRFSLSPFYQIYRRKYKKMLRSFLSKSEEVLYISEKMRDEYNKHFNLSGKTMHLTSSIERREFQSIKTPPVISYFGNIRFGRNESLAEIGKALFEINPEWKLNVYTNENLKSAVKVIENAKGINLNAAIPYDEVTKRILSSDIIVIVEGFKKNDVLTTRYSLSTKTADSIRAGVNVLAYGSKECGAMIYMESMKCAKVVTDKKSLKFAIESFILDYDLQKDYYENSKKIAMQNHDLDTNALIFESIVNKISSSRKKRQ